MERTPEASESTLRVGSDRASASPLLSSFKVHSTNTTVLQREEIESKRERTRGAQEEKKMLKYPCKQSQIIT